MSLIISIVPTSIPSSSTIDDQSASSSITHDPSSSIIHHDRPTAKESALVSEVTVIEGPAESSARAIRLALHGVSETAICNVMIQLAR